MCLATPLQAQPTRILFVLDASGSMKDQWQGHSKFDLAKDILTQTIDSIAHSSPNVECALRVFGHQFPRSAYNCTDSKLEVDFAKNNAAAIRQKLDAITPQGQTPIAYSLEQSLDDFPDTTALNAIIVITDGHETCKGDLCSLNAQFEAKHISLKPFIVGLGLSDSVKHLFDCLGNFYDVQNEDMFSNVLHVVISKVLNRTSAQINLLDAYSNPTITNIEYTLYDHATGKAVYDFVHALNAKGNPDTLFPDAKKKYDLVVHSFPPVEKDNIELELGIHNIIAADVPLGSLELDLEGNITSFSNITCLVRQAGHHEILYVQDLNSTQRYLAGSYDLEFLTLPRVIMNDVQVEPSQTLKEKIPVPGTLSVIPSELGVASVFLLEKNVLSKVYDFYSIKATQSVALQPGSYVVVYRPDKGKKSEKTKSKTVTVTSGKSVSVKF